MTLNDPDVIAEITSLFNRYEQALMTNNISDMDALFHGSQATVRYGVGEVLYGIDEIRAFRKGRGGSPQRNLGHCAIASYRSDLATTNVEFFRKGSNRRGRQSQTWVRFPDGWKIVSAHVSIENTVS